MAGTERGEGRCSQLFGPSWTAEKLGRKLGNIRLYRQMCTGGDISRYEPGSHKRGYPAEKAAETESLKQYACRHFAEPYRKWRNGESWKVTGCARTLAKAGLWMGIQHGHLVLHDGFDKQLDTSTLNSNGR